MMNEYAKSKEWFDNFLGFMEHIQIYLSWIRWSQLGTARCGIMLGDTDVNLESLRAIPKKKEGKASEGWGCRYLGEIHLGLGDSHVAEAEQWMRKAIEADFRNGMMFNLGFDHGCYGEYFKGQGDRNSAQEQFGKAVDILRTCGADGWVEKYEKELEALS